MRAALVSGVLAGLLAAPGARADLPVIDGANIAKWISQAQQMETEIQGIQNTVTSLTDVPVQVIGGFQALISQGVSNPLSNIMENVNALRSGNLAGLSGSNCGGAVGILQGNQYGAPTGNDFTAVIMRANAVQTAGIMACTHGMMQATQTRIANLGSMLNALTGSHDITQIAAVSARIQHEQHDVQAEQLQLQTIALHAALQRQAMEDAVQQKMRSDSEKRARETAPTSAPATAIQAPQPFRAPGA